MRRRLRISVLVDWNATPNDDPNFVQQPPPAETEYHVIDALRQLGHTVGVVSMHEDLREVMGRLEEQRPELVFNLTEELGGNRTQDCNIAAMLDLMRLPYTGSGPLGLALCRDKGLCKRLLSTHRIRVPQFITVPPGKPVRLPRSFPLPAVIKPHLGDGSDGIANDSYAESPARVAARVRFVHERMKQSAIVEEYIDGRELYVAVQGNQRLTVLPAREVTIGRRDGDAPLLATYHAKFNHDYQERWQIEYGFASLEPAVWSRVQRVCRRTYRVLHIRDYGRIDLRLRPDGHVVVLEANANPDIAYGEEVAESAEKAGIPYLELIDRIVRSAWRRVRDASPL